MKLKLPLLIFTLMALWIYASKADAAIIQIQTGRYMGTAATKSITGVGFQPEMVIIKAHGTSGRGAVFQTSAMSAGNTAFFQGLADDTTTDITFTSDGFDVSSDADVNTVDGEWYWIAFRGSDCTSAGTFCVGSYTGNGIAGNAITSVGFQPDLVWVKKSVSTGGGAQNGVWRSSAMAANESNFFVDNNSTTTAITSLDSAGFTLGVSTTANENTRTYWYVAFKESNRVVDVGSYTGSGALRDIDRRIDSGLNFRPDFVFVKNSNAVTPVDGRLSNNENHDQSISFDDATFSNTSIVNFLDTGGFRVSTDSDANGSGDTIYYAAFGSASKFIKRGTFQMQTGTYTGSGATTSITGVGFSPDLVIIKHRDQATDQYAVYTAAIDSDESFEFAAITGDIAGAIISLDSDGFQIGGNPNVNTLNDTYYWVAFGNAKRPSETGGASDFFIDFYEGSSVDNRNIFMRSDFKPDFITIQRDAGGTANQAIMRTSVFPVDSSVRYGATASEADFIQAFFDDGFQLGTNVRINDTGSTFNWFGFKKGPNFTVGSYVGNGADNRNISIGFKPDFIIIKKRTGGTAQGAVMKFNRLGGDATLPFLNTAVFSDGIQDFVIDGIQVGTNDQVNGNTFTYDYAAWKIQRTSVRIRGTIRLRSTHRLR